MPKKLGLVLSGGGARGAYQAGVLAGIQQIAQDSNFDLQFEYLSGVSAGAINAAAIAADCDNIKTALEKLTLIWRSVQAEQVYSTDSITMGRIGLQWMRELSLGSLTGTTPGRSLLETGPLRNLITKNISFKDIDKNIAEGRLKALAITALNYANSATVTFIQGKSPLPSWDKGRKRSELTALTAEHIMASSAIPLLFPPVHVEGRFFGDGAVRNHAPCSPLIYLGAEKLLIVGVRRQVPTAHERRALTEPTAPSVARVMNTLLNGALLDAIELDVEKLHRLNEFYNSLAAGNPLNTNLKFLDYIFISPSADIGELAIQLSHNLPRVVRFLLKGLGSIEDASEITSYLLFSPEFCSRLVDIGIQDTLARRSEIIQFLNK